MHGHTEVGGVVIRGDGPDVVLVHGSATDREAWTTQLATLPQRFRVVIYDRRGSGSSPLPDGCSRWSVSEHADDLEALVKARTQRPLVVGSSFGAVCTLEMVRRSPELVAGMVLIEPPLPESDEAPPVPESFLDEFDRVLRDDGGPAAASFFLRNVLGKEAFEAMPTAWRERSLATHAAIRLDSEALMTYRPRYGELATLSVPTLLLGGGRSAPHFRATLRTLERALPNAQVEILPRAGHMLHAESARSFARLLATFADRAGEEGS